MWIKIDKETETFLNKYSSEHSKSVIKILQGSAVTQTMSSD